MIRAARVYSERLESQGVELRGRIAEVNGEVLEAVFGTFDLLDDVADQYVSRANQSATTVRRAGEIPSLDQQAILGGIDTTNFLQPPEPGMFTEVSDRAWRILSDDLSVGLQRTAPRFSRLWESFSVNLSSSLAVTILSGDYSNVGEAIAAVFARIFLQAAIQAAATSALESLGLIAAAGTPGGAPTAHDGTIVPSGPDRVYRLRALETVRTPEQEDDIQDLLSGRTGNGDQFIFAPQIMGEYTEAERARLSRELRNFYGQFEQEGNFIRQRYAR